MLIAIKHPEVLQEAVVWMGWRAADEAALFFGGALGVQGDEAGEKLLFEDGGVEIVVDLLEDGDEAFVMDLAVLGGQGRR